MTYDENKKWVEKLPSVDRDAPLELTDEDLSLLNSPREMIFCIYKIQNADILDKLQNIIKKAGWEVEANHDPDDIELYALEAKKDEYVISKASYLSDTKFFADIANQSGSSYDGWYASN